MYKLHFAEDDLKIDEVDNICKYLKEKEQIEIIDNKKIRFKNFCGYFKDKLVIPKKLANYFNLIGEENFEEIYNKQFQQFLEKILIELSKEHIIYTLSLTKTFVVENSVNDSRIFKLLLLLELKDELITSLYLIFSNLHKKINRYKTYKHLEDVSEIDSNVISDLIYSLEKLSESVNGFINYNNKKYFSNEILQYESVEIFDTLENRFIKFFLKLILEILDDLKDFLFLNELKDIKNEVEYILQSDIFSEIKDINFFPSNSQVLMKKAGYREIFKIYRLLHISFIPQFFKDLDLAFSLKDMATLWEYNVLIEILKALGNYKIEIDFEKKAKYKTDYEKAKFIFEKGAILYYQNIFKTYSDLEFRPDFYIDYDNKKFIFDAKFRIFNDNKSDILKNMHYYKDGLKVDFAVAVCLGKKDGNFWKIDKEKIPFKSFLELINKSLKGVGYLNLELEIYTKKDL